QAPDSAESSTMMSTSRSARRRTAHPRVERLEAREVPSGASAVLEVHQGDPHAQYQTIQAAVDAAHPGDEIEIFSATYKEAVTVSTPGLSLTAAPGAHVVIKNPGTADNGITVTGVDGFSLANVTVRGFESDGVFLNGVSDFSLAQVKAKDNGEYG